MAGDTEKWLGREIIVLKGSPKEDTRNDEGSDPVVL